MAKSERLELVENIYEHHRSICNYCDVFGQESNRIRWKKRKIMAITPFSHSRSSRSLPIESRYATSYWWLIVADNLSRTVRSYRSLLVKFWTLFVLATLWRWGGCLGSTYDVHLWLIGKRVVDSDNCTFFR